MRVHMDADASQESKDFPVAPKGDYVVEVIDKRDGTTKETGRQKVDLFCDIMTEDGKSVGKCWHTMVFVPKGEPGHGMARPTMPRAAYGSPTDTDEYLHKFCHAHVVVDGGARSATDRASWWTGAVHAAVPARGSARPPAPAKPDGEDRLRP